MIITIVVAVYMHTMACMQRSEGNLGESVLSLHLVEAGSLISVTLYTPA